VDDPYSPEAGQLSTLQLRMLMGQSNWNVAESNNVYGNPFQGHCTKDRKPYDLFWKANLFSGSSGYSVCTSFCGAHAGPRYVGMVISSATGT